MNKLILFIAAILLLGGGWYYWNNRSTTPAEVTETPSQNGENTNTSTENSTSTPTGQTQTLGKVVINMTDTGFEPSTVTIKKGQTVDFVNVGKETHWPASDLHPTHEIYSEFDSDKPVAPGETYSFTFERVGKWNMHDHLHARFRGVIDVQE